MNKNLKIALIHDDLVQWGGAERVLEGLCEIFPDAPIFTSVFDYSDDELFERFGNKKIITSFLQKIPGWKRLYRQLLPFYPIAFEQFDFSEYDLIISHTTRFAKSIITQPQTKHICYMHTTPRFLWHLSGQKSFGFWEPMMSKLRLYDQISARRVDLYLAGSENARARIKKYYKRDSEVVYPFVDMERFDGITTFDGGYFVLIGRINKSNRYKRFDLGLDACQDLNIPLKIIGDGDDVVFLQKKVVKHKLVQFMGNLSDRLVVRVLSGARGLIVPGEEDFGLTPLEVQALGKPVIAYARGGALETVISGKTGILFEEQTSESLAQAIKDLEEVKINSEDCKNNVLRFSKDIFKQKFAQLL